MKFKVCWQETVNVSAIVEAETEEEARAVIMCGNFDEKVDDDWITATGPLGYSNAKIITTIHKIV